MEFKTHLVYKKIFNIIESKFSWNINYLNKSDSSTIETISLHLINLGIN